MVQEACGDLRSADWSSAADRVSRRLDERALAAHALVEEIRNAEPDDAEFDPEDMLRAKLDALEADFADIAARLESLQRVGDRGLAAPAADRCKLSARAAAVAVRELKGAIQAHDANAMTLGRTVRRPACTGMELDEHLADAFGV